MRKEVHMPELQHTTEIEESPVFSTAASPISQQQAQRPPTIYEQDVLKLSMMLHIAPAEKAEYTPSILRKIPGR
jgi:hypothetical protein